MKKFLSVLFVFVLVLTASVTAFAQNPASWEIITHGTSSMVYFEINGEVVYCVDANKLAPKTGTVYSEIDASNVDLSALDEVFVNINTSEREKNDEFYKVAQQVIWDTLNPGKNYRAKTEAFLGTTAVEIFDELTEPVESEFTVKYKVFATADKNYQRMATAESVEITPVEIPDETVEIPMPEPVPETTTDAVESEPEPEVEVVPETPTDAVEPEPVPEIEVVIPETTTDAVEPESEPEVEMPVEPEPEVPTEPVVPETVPETEPETEVPVKPEVEVSVEPETEKPVVTQKIEVVTEPETEPEVEVLGEVISKEEVEIPQTGSTENIAALAAMTLLSGAAIIILSKKKETT